MHSWAMCPTPALLHARLRWTMAGDADDDPTRTTCLFVLVLPRVDVTPIGWVAPELGGETFQRRSGLARGRPGKVALPRR